MRRGFLIGNFLPAYGQQFGRVERRAAGEDQIPVDQLAHSFDQRAKRYRRRRSEYAAMIQVGLFAALGITIGAFHLQISPGSDSTFATPEQEIVHMEEILQTEQIKRPPPPPRPPVPVEVPDETDLELETLDMDVSLDINQVMTDMPPPPPSPVMEEEDEDEIFVVVEQLPEIVGGMGSLQGLVRYPEIARRAGLSGTVVVKIVVNTDGKPSDPEILRGVHESLDEEAVRAVMELRFEPARQRGRAVRVYMSIPVRFELR